MEGAWKNYELWSLFFSWDIRLRFYLSFVECPRQILTAFCLLKVTLIIYFLLKAAIVLLWCFVPGTNVFQRWTSQPMLKICKEVCLSGVFCRLLGLYKVLFEYIAFWIFPVWCKIIKWWKILRIQQNQWIYCNLPDKTKCHQVILPKFSWLNWTQKFFFSLAGQQQFTF